MPTTVRVEIKGLQELGRSLQAYKETMQKKTVRNATRAGAVVIRDAAKKVRPPNPQTGALIKGITAWRSRKDSKDQGIEVWRVGVKKVSKRYVDNAKNRSRGRINKKGVGKKYQVEGPSYYWRFLEFGTSRMSPKPFFRPAFDTNKAKAVEAMIEKIRQALIIKPENSG